MKTIVCCLMLLILLPTTLLAQDEAGSSQTDVDKADRQPSLSDSVVNEPIGEVEPLVDPVTESESAQPVAATSPEVMPMVVQPASELAPTTVPLEAYSQMPPSIAITGLQVMAGTCTPIASGAEVATRCQVVVTVSVGCQPCCQPCSQPCIETARCRQVRPYCQSRCRRSRLLGCRR